MIRQCKAIHLYILAIVCLALFSVQIQAQNLDLMRVVFDLPPVLQEFQRLEYSLQSNGDQYHFHLEKGDWETLGPMQAQPLELSLGREGLHPLIIKLWLNEQGQPVQFQLDGTQNQDPEISALLGLALTPLLLQNLQAEDSIDTLPDLVLQEKSRGQETVGDKDVEVVTYSLFIQEASGRVMADGDLFMGHFPGYELVLGFEGIWEGRDLIMEMVDVQRSE